MKRVVIAGGGAAGFMAAITAAKMGGDKVKVTVVEKNARPLRKVMITGKGRCNLTNNCGLDALIANTVRNPRFLYSAFSAFTPGDTMAFFENECKIPLKTERGNRVFPVSDKASDIVDALLKAASNAGVEKVNASVSRISASNGAVDGVVLDNGEFVGADSIVIATGGISYPATGSTGDGYRFAADLGHTIIKPSPSLVSLKCHEGFCARLAGLSLKNIRLSVFEEGVKKPVFSDMGEMLFTHFGISGPLTLTASAKIRDPETKRYKAVIDLKPALSLKQLDDRILRDFREFGSKDFSNSLDKLLPKSLIPVAVALSRIDPHIKVNAIDAESRKGFCELLKNFTLTSTAFGPVEEAVITRGGVCVKEINPATMESKLVKGLFFAGEVIDVDALTGGFNLQIAFSTGYAAGKNV